MFRIIKAFLVIVLLLTTLYTAAQAAPRALNAPGELDTSFAGFGTGGKVTLAGLSGGSMALAPDGKVVVVGYNATNLMVWRYLPSGKPDPSFGSGGAFAYTPVGFDTITTDVAVQADGKIVIVGQNFAGNNDSSDFLVMRVLA